MVTSSAVVGSSATSSCGSHEIAMAIITRCSMPPDSSAGIWWKTRSGWRRPTASNSSSARRCAARRPRRQLDPQHLGELMADGEHRVQVGRRVLEHRAQVAAVQALPAAPRQGGHVEPGERHRAALDRAAGGQHAERGPAGQRLAAAGLPDQPDDLAGPDPQRDAAHRGGRPVVHADVQVVQAQHLVSALSRRPGADGGAGRDQATDRDCRSPSARSRLGLIWMIGSAGTSVPAPLRSRKASASAFSAPTVMAISAPGMNGAHGAWDR